MKTGGEDYDKWETNNTVKTGSTPRKNTKSQSYLAMFGTWLHHVWCALVSIVLCVLKLVRASGKIGGAWLSCRLTGE